MLRKLQCSDRSKTDESVYKHESSGSFAAHEMKEDFGNGLRKIKVRSGTK